MYYKCCSPCDLTADKTSGRVTGCSFSDKEFAKFLLLWCGWGLLNRNHIKRQNLSAERKERRMFHMCGAQRGELRASSAPSPRAGPAQAPGALSSLQC